MENREIFAANVEVEVKLIFGNLRNLEICEIWGHFEDSWVIFKVFKVKFQILMLYLIIYLKIVEKIEIFVDFLIKFAIFRPNFNFSTYFLIN